MEPQKHFQKQPRVFTIDEEKDFVTNVNKFDTLKIKDPEKSLKDINSKILKEPAEVLNGIKNGVDKFVNKDTDFHLTPPKLNLDKFKNQNLIYRPSFITLDRAMGQAQFLTHQDEVAHRLPLTRVMMLPKNEREKALKEALNDFKKNIKTLKQNPKLGVGINDAKSLGFIASHIDKAGGIDNFVENALNYDKSKDMDKKGGEQKDLPKTKDHRLLQKTHKDVRHETKPLMSGKTNTKSEPKQNLNLNNR